MISGWLLALLVCVYLAILFIIARIGDARADAGRSLLGPSVYALSLAVYCTSWTFFGSVGRASSGGLSFLTIYLGPTLMLLAGGVVLKMLRICKQQRITSIADFIASRYGKSHLLAGLVTVIAVLGIVPYIALQLKAVAAALEVFFPSLAQGSGGLFDPTLLIAALLAIFTILFGTRHLDATERHEGMVAAIAFESLVKLLAFVAVGAFVTWGMFDGFVDLFRRAAADSQLQQLLRPDPAKAGNWLALILLSGFAIILLPRQFQVLVVENVDEGHLRRALWLFPLYLLLINVFVLPLALGGMLHFGGQGNPDTFVLSLPLSQGAEALAILVFIGGLSAATGMVIVETIALSTMICNDLVMPGLLRSTRLRGKNQMLTASWLLGVRRAAIALVLFLGYLYFRLAGEAYALVGIGLISFAAVAQFAPALFGGMYWKQGTRQGALAGLLAGFALWLYTLLLPSFARSGWIDTGFVVAGPWGIGWLRPQALFGLSGLDEITHALWWSLLFNLGLYLTVSLFGRRDALEAAQAERFVDVEQASQALVATGLWRGKVAAEPLLALLERFLGRDRARQRLSQYALSRGCSDSVLPSADAALVAFVERELAGAIGSASARVMIASLVDAEEPGLEEVLDILEEANQIRAYSRELETKQQALEQATAELRAANQRLRELDRMKDDFVSTVTHELRTPLTSIRALSEMLHDDPRIDLEQRRRFLGIIVTESERLTRLINQILDLAKLESGRAEWASEPVDVGEIVRAAMASLQALFDEKAVRLGGELPPRGPVVIADHDRLMQVLVNLLSNAVKFAPPTQGEVRVRLASNDYEVRVEVLDNGPGLTADECNVIFEKFRQGGDTMTAKPQGTGLGLPISRQIVEHFGGKLWVESRPGTGACFIFTVPLPAPDV
ncbi:sensor histidine kinase [Dechloromonas sp. ZY10]|uniref:ATP-binding protein n=1 Tax=Dechloromonas aquae TaxID=2664436 RepID=UPI0035283F82